jgi:quercetin dioxygenase-like cupin family protein
MEADMNPSATASEPIVIGGMTVQFLVDSRESNGSVSVFRVDLSVGSHMPVPHSHDAFEETVYGLKGITTFIVDGGAKNIGPGDIICIPRGAVHGFAVSEDEDASILCVSSPGVFGPDYFREIAAVVDAAAGGPPDREAMMAVMKRHGLTPAIPSAG